MAVKKIDNEGESFWVHTVSTNLPFPFFVWNVYCGVVQEKLLHNSMRWDALPESLVMAFLLRNRVHEQCISFSVSSHKQ
jgi:hypothetical protein